MIVSSPSFALLDRSVYDLAEAARLLNAPDSTLRWWLQGRETQGRKYLPVLREERNSDVVVTWGEFIEAAVLRFLRRHRNVTMGELRHFRVEVLSQHAEIRYPLATDELYLKDGRLSTRLLAGIWEPSTGTLFDEEAVREFFERCNWQDHVAVSFQPRREHPRVVVTPQRQFGAPQLRGVRTQALFDLSAAGEPHGVLAEEFHLTGAEVEEAIAFERAIRGVGLTA